MLNFSSCRTFASFPVKLQIIGTALFYHPYIEGSVPIEEKREPKVTGGGRRLELMGAQGIDTTLFKTELIYNPILKLN